LADLLLAQGPVGHIQTRNQAQLVLMLDIQHPPQILPRPHQQVALSQNQPNFLDNLHQQLCRLLQPLLLLPFTISYKQLLFSFPKFHFK
jgi:hypothetical protein